MAELQGGIRFLATAARSPIFLALLAFDLSLITAHVLVMEVFDYPEGSRLARWGRIDRDGSLPETYEAAKMVLAALILFALSRKNGQNLLIAPALLILYLAADNSLRLHENVGKLAGSYRHLGELAFMSIFAILALASAVFAYSRAPAGDRPILIGVFLSILLLGAFATGLDAAHAAVHHVNPSSAKIFNLIEESGELVAQSLILACCAQVLMAVRSADIERREHLAHERSRRSSMSER